MRRPRLEALAPVGSQSLGEPNPEDLKHGAVLCIWSIYLAARQMGDECFANEDAEFKAALSEGIERIDQFIIDNAPTTSERLAKAKRDMRFVPPEISICRPDLVSIYLNMRQAGPEALRRSIADLLSVPRKPAMNPCL